MKSTESTTAAVQKGNLLRKISSAHCIPPTTELGPQQASGYPKIWKEAFALSANVRFTRTPDIELLKKRQLQEGSGGTKAPPKSMLCSGQRQTTRPKGVQQSAALGRNPRCKDSPICKGAVTVGQTSLLQTEPPSYAEKNDKIWEVLCRLPISDTAFLEWCPL